MKALLNQAEIVYNEYPVYTITAKPEAPPDGNKRSYWSIGPYFWPQPITPQNPRGEPYFRRDGVFNAQVRRLLLSCVACALASKVVDVLLHTLSVC